jgi:predicted acetyltransferase
MLYAYRQGFYARHEYAAVRPHQRLVFSPESVPRSWTWPHVRAATAADAPAIEALWESAARRGVGALARPPSLWVRLHLDERRVTLMAERGYVAWELVQTEPHAETRMLVHELVAEDDATARALLGAIGAQAGQVREVEMDRPWDDPLALALTDADRTRNGTAYVEHALGTVVAGPMLRVIDVRRAIDARAIDAPLTIEVGGARFDVRGGGPVLRTDRATLAQILFGGMRPSDARRLGRAEGDAPDAPFALPAFFNPDPF